MTLGHLPFILISREDAFIKGMYITGCITSLLNHYFQSKNKYLQTLDRSVMTIGAVNDLFYMYDSYTFSLWFASIYFYTYSKILKNLGLPFHVLAHVFVTLCHARILVDIGLY